MYAGLYSLLTLIQYMRIRTTKTSTIKVISPPSIPKSPPVKKGLPASFVCMILVVDLDIPDTLMPYILAWAKFQKLWAAAGKNISSDIKNKSENIRPIRKIFKKGSKPKPEFPICMIANIKLLLTIAETSLLVAAK